MSIQKILGLLRKAITDHNMIGHNDKIAVGVSGGKDSLLLLTALKRYLRFSDEKFTLHAITVDMGFKNTDKDMQNNLRKYIEDLDIEYHVVPTNIAEVIFDIRKESNPCSLCSKMRRGALNTKAIELGCNKIALGHHADDLVETLFLSMMYEGRLSTFSPTSYMDRSDITLIRPLIYVEEKNIRAITKDYPVLKNPCPADKNTKRQYMKNLIAKIQEDIPFAKDRIFGAITNPYRYNLWGDKEDKKRKE